MMNRLVNLLNKSGLDGFIINATNKEIYQLYFVKEKVETVRSGNFDEISVTVFVKHDGKLGDAKFNVSPSNSDEEILAQIATGKENALAVFNPPYELIKNEKCEIPLEGKPLNEMANEIAEAIFSVKNENGAKLNATEIFVNKLSKRIINSEGVDKSATLYKCMIETIPTFDLENESVEIYAQKNFSKFTKEEIKEYISNKLFEVEARAKAKKISLDKSMNVLIRDEEIIQILDSYVGELNYASLANDSNALKVGDNIQKGEGDKITIRMKNHIPECSESAEFDEDGASFKEKVIIENGVVKDFYGGNRFAQYVSKECTGNLPLAEINTGKLTKESLKGETYLECLQFSGIQCDLLNDYLGGEVRLAILHKGDEEIPVCGFSISGRLSELMANVKLSARRTHNQYYSGPEYMYFEGFQVL